MRQTIISVLDFFYPIVKRFMPLQTYRYAACGSITTLLGLISYFVGYQYLFARKIFDFGFFAFKPHMAALFLSFIVSYVIGFCFSKYIVWSGSNLKGRIQLFRYFLMSFFNLLVNYLLLKLLVEFLLWNALISQLITTCVIIVISYLSQKHFSFRVKK